MSRKTVFDPYDPDQHRREARRVCRARGRELRDRGCSTAEILADAKFMYWHGLSYSQEMMEKAHARFLVGDIYGERGAKLPKASYGYERQVQASFADMDNGQSNTPQFEWARATERMVLADPLIQAEVIRSRMGVLQAQLANLPRHGLRFRKIRRAIDLLGVELNNLAS